MTAYGTMATVVLLTSFSLNDVWRLGSTAAAAAASTSGLHPTLSRVLSAGNVYGTSAADADPDGKSYSENSSEPNDYDSDGAGDDQDDGGGGDDDSYADGNNSREHEDQLDQDDPGNFTVVPLR